MSEPSKPKPELEWPWPINPDRVADSLWAKHDPGVERQYPRQWVVAYQRQVVAASHDADEARRLAAERTGQPIEELIATWIAHPDDWFTNV